MESLDKSDALRMLDANLNRASEGLRTIEDIARLVSRDATVAGWTKALRHEVAQLASLLPRDERLAARAVHSDAGTSLTSPSERDRQSWNELAVAAAERVTQSLRVIEESAKLHFPDLSSACKQLRYRAYDRLAQIELKMSGHHPFFSAPGLYLLVDCQLPVEQFVERLNEIAEAGVELFQIRDKRCDGLKLLEYSQAAVKAVGSHRIIVNDRVDIAMASGAAGVHLGQDDMPIESVRRIATSRLWIGISTHDILQARKAQADGADYIGCGPTFPSQTKQFADFPGLGFLGEVADHIDIPAYAIGGIGTHNVDQVQESRMHRVAVSSAIWRAHSPATEAKRLLDALHQR